MPSDLIPKIAILFQAVPPLASLRVPGHLPAARAWIVAGVLGTLIINLVGWLLRELHLRNLGLTYLSAPLDVTCTLMAVSAWMTREPLRRGLRYGIPLFIAVELVLLLTGIERIQDFSLVVHPARGLLLLGAALLLLVTRISEEQGRLRDSDWFWIGLALCLRYGITVAIGPFSRIFLHNDVTKVTSLYIAKAWIEIVVALLITRGLLCPVRRPASLPSTSPVSAPLSLS